MSVILRPVMEESRRGDIEYSVEIRATIGDVFRALTVSRIIDEWGGGPARVQAKVNGRYSLWDGEMHGVIKEVEFPRRLVHTLREASWEDNWLDSLVSWRLDEIQGRTRLSLLHAGLPSRRLCELHEDGWGEYFLGPLKAWLERRPLKQATR